MKRQLKRFHRSRDVHFNELFAPLETTRILAKKGENSGRVKARFDG
jgi:hypothetical protein